MAAFLLALILGFLSDGVHHDDDLTHFLMARWSATFPEYLLNFWARPGFTVPMSAIAWIGSPQTAWHLCRIASALVTLAATLLAIRVADRLAVRPLWAVALACLLQPIATLLSFTTLVENVASLYLIAAVALLLASRPILASAIFSVALVTRYDTLILLPIWWLAIWFGRFSSSRRTIAPPIRLAACAAALWAPAVHQFLLIILLNAKPWVYFASPAGSTDYAPAGPLVYIPQLMLAVPPAVLALAIVGGARLAAAGKWLVPLMAGTFILAHVVLRARGMYASGGFARFLVAVAPFVAICAAAAIAKPTMSGYDAHRRNGLWLTTAAVLCVGVLALRSEAHAGRIPLHDWRPYVAAIAIALSLAGGCLLVALWPASRFRRRLAAFVGVLLALTVAGQDFAIVRPLRIGPTPATIRTVLGWLDGRGFAIRPTFSASPWLAYERDLVEMPRVRKSRRLVASMPVGSIIIWDRTYCPSDYHRLGLNEFGDNSAYRLLAAWHTGQSVPTPVDSNTMQVYTCAAGSPDFFVFEKIANTPVPDSDPPAYPPEIAQPVGPAGTFYILGKRR